MRKAYKVFVVFCLVVFAYSLGGMTGYAIGYNTKYAEEIVAYRGKR